MLQLGEQPRLAQEALVLVKPRVVRMQELEGDPTAGAAIEGAEDCAHSALSCTDLDLEAVGDNGPFTVYVHVFPSAAA